jgi:hypothetical protein
VTYENADNDVLSSWVPGGHGCSGGPCALTADDRRLDNTNNSIMNNATSAMIKKI